MFQEVIHHQTSATSVTFVRRKLSFEVSLYAQDWGDSLQKCKLYVVTPFLLRGYRMGNPSVSCLCQWRAQPSPWRQWGSVSSPDPANIHSWACENLRCSCPSFCWSWPIHSCIVGRRSRFHSVMHTLSRLVYRWLYNNVTWPSAMNHKIGKWAGKPFSRTSYKAQSYQ